MKIRRYEIFSGRTRGDAVRIAAVEGLEAASGRMRLIAKKKPGPYFVFCTETNRILNSIDSSPIGFDQIRSRLVAMLRGIKHWLMSAPSG